MFFRIDKLINKKNTFSLIFLVLVTQLWAQKVINPVPGKWANKQMLVLEIPAGGAAYYSVNGSDPENSGFAYDGPVVIDLEDDVKLRIAFVDRKGKVTSKTVEYTVIESQLPKDSAAQDFIDATGITGYIHYTCGDTLYIPDTLKYSLGQPPEIFEDGREIRISEESVIPRNLPLTVTDGNYKWRFIISINTVMTGLYGRKDVPFEIEDWETIHFSNRRYIYKIDDGWWQLPKAPVKIDRSENHMIYWQSVEYNPENQIKYYVLPPKAQLIASTDEEGVVTIKYSGEDGYQFGIYDNNGEVNDLFEQLKIDTFHGDKFKGTLEAGMFFDSVFQGLVYVDYNINKRLPSDPVIKPSVEGAYVRQDVEVEVSNLEEDLPIYVCVAGPVPLDKELDTAEGDIPGLDSNDYELWNNSKIVLKTSNDNAVAYRVRAYSVDENGNRSQTVSYSVILDTCNFYCDSSYKPGEGVVCDGSRNRPFISFEQIVPLINGNRFVHIRASGNLVVPDQKIVLTSNCQIDGGNACKFVFNPNTRIILRNSSLAMSNCVIALEDKVRNLDSGAGLFTLERGVLDFENVELSAQFGKNGTVIYADGSVCNIRKSGISSTADGYTSLIASNESKIFIKDSRFSTFAGTSVNFSAQGGTFELKNSLCNVGGIMGRVGELFSTHSTIVENIFTSDLKKSQNNNKPIYMDSTNTSIAFDKNKIEGF